MDAAQRLLFGSFPRELATPRRQSVFGPEHFDRAVCKANRFGNVYSSIARLPPGGPECDKLMFDLDAKPDGYEHLHERELFGVLREDDDEAQRILGGVVEDMQTLATSEIDGAGPFGVFTGLGVHVYFFFQPTANAKNAMLSTTNKIISEHGITTADPQVIGDERRISKIPNVQRFDDGEPCGLVSVPLSQEDMSSMDAPDLLALSVEPRVPLFDISLTNVDTRPEMTVYDEYLQRSGSNYPERELGDSVDVSKRVEWVVDEFIDLPCVSERILTRNPGQAVRFNFAVMLFNYGFNVSEVHDLIRGIGWENYEPKKTKQQLENIWNNKYSDMSCTGMMNKGYCVRTNDPHSCKAYGWSGGTCDY